MSEGQVVHSGLYWRNSMVLPGRNTINTALAWLPKRYEDRDSRDNGAYRVRQRWWGDVQVATDAGKALSFSASLGALQENLGDWTCALAAGTTWRPNDRLSLDFDLHYKRRRGWVVHAEERSFGTYTKRRRQLNDQPQRFLAVVRADHPHPLISFQVRRSSEFTAAGANRALGSYQPFHN